MKKKNILFISESIDSISGAEKSMLEIISLLNKNIFSCYIGSTKSEEFKKKISQLNIPQINIHLHERGSICSYIIHLFRAILIFKRHHIDLVYITSSGTYWKPAEIIAAILTNTPIITHMRWWKYNMDSFLRYSKIMISNSYFTSKTILNSKYAKKSRVILNFVDSRHYVISKKKSSFIRVTYVGQISPVKGIKYLIDAMCLIKERSDIKCRIVGRDSKANPGYKLEMINYCKKFNLKNIEFHDYTQNICDIYNNTDILALPSLEEPFGRVLVEAGHFNIPSIATNVGGIPEVVNNDTGILIPPKQPEKMARAIIRLADDPDLRFRMGNAAHKRVNKEFNVAKQIRKIEDLLLSV